MKKILAIALAAIMVLGLATSALAVSWAAPVTATTASPFAIEVIKLAASSDITGAAYYTVLNDAAAYDYSTIYYAIKLSLPSVADANAYYGNSGFVEDNKVKVTIDWTNVSGKSSKVVTVPLTSEAQTLWFDGSNFTAVWQQALAASCGCGESHILSAVASGTKEVSIKACVGAAGKLSDVTIGGCYSVSKESYKGIIPCVNCKAQTLSGFLFKGDCAANNVFFATNSANRVTGVYVQDKYLDDIHLGTFENVFSDTLYGWRYSGLWDYNCTYGNGRCTQGVGFKLEVLGTDVVLDVSGSAPVVASSGYSNNIWWLSRGGTDSSAQVAGAFQDWVNAYGNFGGLRPAATDLFRVYTLEDGTYTPVTNETYVNTGDRAFAKNKQGSLTATSATEFSYRIDQTAGITLSDGTYLSSATSPLLGQRQNVAFSGYEYLNDYYVYGDTWQRTASGTHNRLFQQVSATNINCDTNEAAYLNTLNHLYSLLGFTYADVAAGNVYMTEDIILSNFGFSTKVCDTATWGAYTASITVAPVTEVPATGVASFAGFAMIAVAAAAATVARKKRD